MAITFVGTSSTGWLVRDGGSFSYGNANWPVSQEGDRFYWVMVWKDQSATVTANSGIEIGEFADGSVATGVGVGSVRVKAWYLDRTASPPSSVIYTISTTIIGYVTVLVFRKDVGDTWETPSFVTAAITNWTTSSQTVSASSTVAVPDGSAVIGFAGIRDDTATFTRPTTGIDGSGITWNGNYVESPATHGSSTLGNDIAADAGYRLVTTGATTTLTQTATLSAAETGSAMWIVQALVGGAPADDRVPYRNQMPTLIAQ